MTLKLNIFERMKEEGHEQIFFCQDDTANLRMLIGIHDTTLGPALGGCRMWPYDHEHEAVTDVLRLSRGMTSKSASTGQNFGGGKAVLWGDAAKDKDEALFRTLGRFVEGLQGNFITGTDVGTTGKDFVWSQQETNYLVALPESHGGSGDSSLTTAFGVFRGMQACSQTVFGSDDLKGRRVALQGGGKVGYHLARFLHEAGARLVIADIDQAKVDRIVDEFGASPVSCDDIISTACDIFSPNALGGILHEESIRRLQCRIVAGSANNQLLNTEHAELLRQRDILYAPDYVINAGGLIQVADELHGFVRERAMRKTSSLYDLLLNIFAIAKERDICTARAADIMVKERLDAIGQLKRMQRGT